MTTHGTKILAAGLPPPPGVDQASVPVLANEIKKATEKNWDLTLFVIDPQEPVDDVIEKWRVSLKSEAWTAVSIGFGVRGNIELTDLFEKLVNAAVDEGISEFAFAKSPSKIVEAFERVL